MKTAAIWREKQTAVNVTVEDICGYDTTKFVYEWLSITKISKLKNYIY